MQGQELEHLLEVVISTTKEYMQSRDLVTKKDLENAKLELQKEIVNLRYAMLKFIIWTGCGVSSLVIGAMYTILKLMLNQI